ncbi:MAG: SBBP repeat-containing protein [Patescibacteria group bacterium]|jgi:hypothetical protein
MRQTFSVLLIALLLLAVTSCAGGSGNAVSPVTEPEMTLGTMGHTGQSQTHLWGYYDIYIDIETQTAEAIPNRQAMFTANVVTFLNGNIANLNFHINSVPVGLDYLDVDIDVSITHPFPGLSQYNGYDVRGVFMGDGSATLQYNSDLHYPVLGTDQFMLADPVDEFGGPDGYTRWFNKPEFSTGGLPVLQYTQGKLATPDFNGDATLNAYKYFADGLGKNDNLWDWLNSHATQHGQFSSGTTNTRNYYLRFPNTKGITFGYAVLANWEGEASEFHPSNTPEAVTCNVVDNSNVWYVNPIQNGGNLILDISLFGWSQQPSTIFIESTVLSASHEFTLDEMTPIGGTENYSTYHVEIPADHVTGTTNNELWIIAQYNAHDYTNEFGVTNLADTDPLATFSRCNLTVSTNAPYAGGWALTWGGSGWDYGQDVAVDIAGNVYVTGAFYETVDLDPGPETDYHTSTGIANIFLSKFNPQGDFQWARTWGGPGFNGDHDYSAGVTVDKIGGIYVFGKFWGVADCDPGDGVDMQGTPNATNDFISKFDSYGNYQWARVWYMSVHVPYGIAICNANVLCVTGWFQGTKDFDPGPGIDNHTGKGYLSRFDIGGNYLGACAWDGLGLGIAADNLSNIYIAGYFDGTVDFNPGSDSDPRTSNGGRDAFISKFDVEGNYQWVRAWGGIGNDEAYGTATDNTGNVCISGPFAGLVDFDPSSGVDEHDASGGQSTFLSKFDAQGDFQWAQPWASNYSMGDIAIDPEGSIYAADAKFSSSGVFQWIHPWGGYSSRGLAIDGSKAVYATGGFLGSTDFAPHTPPCNADPDNHSSFGSCDAYLVKFLPDGCW